MVYPDIYHLGHLAANGRYIPLQVGYIEGASYFQGDIRIEPVNATIPIPSLLAGVKGCHL